MQKANGKKAAAFSARRLAYEALRLEEGGAFANLALKETFAQFGTTMRGEDRAFASALFYSVLEHKITLDFYFAQFAAKRPPIAIRTVLRMGGAQILYMAVPEHAAISESVALLKQIGKGGSGGFVNAMLRRLLREKDALPQPKGSEAEQLSIRLSKPVWLVEQLLPILGAKETQEFLSMTGEGEGITVRYNALKCGEEDLDIWFDNNGFERKKGRYLAQARTIQNGGDPSQWQAFQEGMLAIQSESSMLAASILGVEPGMAVLDCCAAPGGKAMYLAAAMQEGELIAWDDHEHRVELIRQNANRLGATFVQAQCQDAAKKQEELVGHFDRILLDAPCSGLGVLRSKPDIAYRKTPEDLAELWVLQERILDNVATYLKVGGQLLYCTCTVLPEENEEQITKFLQTNTGFKRCEIQLPEGLETARLASGAVQLWPQRHGLDGFYMSLLERIA